MQQCETILFTVGEVAYRNRIGSLAGELLLIHVEAHTHDAVTDGASHQFVLDENAGNFSVVGIDVIGPFDGQLRNERFQAAIDSQRHGLRKEKLPTGFQEVWTKQDAEQ